MRYTSTRMRPPGGAVSEPSTSSFIARLLAATPQVDYASVEDARNPLEPFLRSWEIHASCSRPTAVRVSGRGGVGRGPGRTSNDPNHQGRRDGPRLRSRAEHQHQPQRLPGPSGSHACRGRPGSRPCWASTRRSGLNANGLVDADHFQTRMRYDYSSIQEMADAQDHAPHRTPSRRAPRSAAQL